MPLEDFLTEALAGVLESSSELLDSYASEVLRLPGHGYRIATRHGYMVPETGERIIPDLVVENDANLCFVEHKVHSGETGNQLERYSRYLASDAGQIGRTAWLRYCTKYYNPKEVHGIDFLQYRWADVAAFLRQHIREGTSETELMNTLYAFLKEHDMNEFAVFEYEDLIALSRLQRVFSQVAECVGPEVREHFEKVLGKLDRNGGSNPVTEADQDAKLADFNRLSIWRTGVLDEQESSELTLSVQGKDMEDNPIPILVAQCFVSSEHPSFAAFRKAATNYGKFDRIEELDSDGNEAVLCWFQQDIGSLVSRTQQLDTIKQWFIDKIDALDAFRTATKHLNWT